MGVVVDFGKDALSATNNFTAIHTAVRYKLKAPQALSLAGLFCVHVFTCVDSNARTGVGMSAGRGTLVCWYSLASCLKEHPHAAV